VRVRGPLASRPNDELLLGAVFGHLSSGFRAAQAAEGIVTVVNGNVVEVSWRAALTHYVAVQPLFQSSGNPGGATDARRANVFGVRLELVLLERKERRHLSNGVSFFGQPRIARASFQQ